MRAPEPTRGFARSPARVAPEAAHLRLERRPSGASPPPAVPPELQPPPVDRSRRPRVGASRQRRITRVTSSGSRPRIHPLRRALLRLTLRLVHTRAEGLDWQTLFAYGR